MEKFLLVLFAYLLGSVLPGEIIAKLKGVNLREVGSGNVGATNVSRVLGKKFGALVFFLDMLKGFIPTYLAISFYGVESKAVMFAGIASVLGHMFSIFDRFRGGKGVATAFGVILAVSFKLALLSLLVWFVILQWKRYVSLASITASVVAPLLFLISGYPSHIFLMGIVIAVLIVYKHKPNIDRLLRGQELKV
ncbi:glycerol-3-phosphate acyltransferase PlsY [Hydrogenivirga caldilitoris]|uniref:Glycerol-3-phosphate acyltransferase n=1 Tax=Hydrogenivirga caldilitoris TaxID=246264 RepID=A0A497XQ88_9AQUI|nr:glycerol-3-phosphate 1-O-acyltransferase PlsY [Hydrogenivirga caldilitoris]RLJ70320.1 glycerol-3-phosphate acyltransferase PlsY [Hydrogenivirga caldilitoris]